MDFGIYSSIPESDPMVGFINSELSQKRLRFYLPENDLGKALTHLYRSSRTSIEENGANTLYLALGLLKWYETPSSERPRYAPILLLPVEIIRKSAAKGYVIRSREEETMMNITLLEMLRQNFGISISGLDPLPTDESGVNVKLIYSIIRNSIKNQRKWDVEEQAILGIFSFNKFIMWNDIHNNANKLVQNKIVSSLINGKIEWEAATEEIDATDMDKQVSPADIVLPIIADSSQLEAIYEAVHDKTFILHECSGNRKIANDYQYYRQRALQRKTCFICSGKDGSPLRCAKQIGSYRAGSVLSGNSFQQDKEIRRYLSTKRNHGNYQADTSRRIQKGSGTPAEFTSGIESIYRSPA